VAKPLTDTLRDAPAGRIGLGCWRLSGPGRPERAAAIETIRAAHDAGIRVFDTADSYSLSADDHGYGEDILAEALRDASAFVVTKGGSARPGGVWTPRGSAEWLRRAIEASVERLGRPIDCYLLHEVDPAVPIEVSMGPLFRAREEGLVIDVGLSNVTTDELERCRALGAIAVVQNRLSVTVRPRGSAEMLEATRRAGVWFMAHSPLGPTIAEGDASRAADHPVVKEVARRHGETPERIALAWLAAQAPHVIPIPGARRATTARSSASATQIRLTTEDLQALDTLTATA
jgi:aryl-alcohol dehydrogenase-like predicted oxidoreductase